MSNLTPNQQAVLQAYREGELRGEAWGRRLISEHTGIAEASVGSALKKLRTEGIIAERMPGDNRPAPRGKDVEQKEPPTTIVPSGLRPEDVGYAPTMEAADGQASLIASLRAENEALRQQLTWATHTDVAASASGGTMTINISDWHLCDRNHLPTALSSCEEKTATVIAQFRPRRLRVIENGDIIPGRGIYKEQALESILPKSDQQVSAAAIRFYEFVHRCADAAGIDLEDVEVRKTPGNHDYSEHEPTSLPFVYLLRMLGMKAKFVGKYTVWNLADKGVHNALFFHGYGHSRHSPSSPGLIDETLKLILKLATEYGHHGRRAIRRVSHGHTHWMAVGMERAAGVTFDVTGGFQRFERVKQGYNERPTGWICYASPAGGEDVIPIPVHPDPDALEADMTDPVLERKNYTEAQRCLGRFAEEAEARGIASDFWKEARANREAAEAAA